jgi:hypothetical protein
MTDYAAEMMRLSKLLDDGLAYMGRQVKEYAAAEMAYRLAKGKAWVQVRAEIPSGTVPERSAWVEATTAELRYARDLADGMRQTGLEAVRSRRAQISAYQSLLARDRAEAEFARVGSES